MMIMMDPPEHTNLRKLVSRAFTPRRDRRPRGPDREALRNELLDTVDGQDEFDYIDNFAGLLPPTVILALVGYPEGHADEFRARADESLHIEDGEQGSRTAGRSTGDGLARAARSTTRRSPCSPS